jgi:uncharacterized delta-60 repeat protein
VKMTFSGLSVVLVFSLVLNACAQPAPAPTPKPTPAATVTGISVKSDLVAPTAGSTITLTATVTGTGSFDDSLLWSVPSTDGILSATAGKIVKLTFASKPTNAQVLVMTSSVSNPSVKTLTAFDIKGVPVVTGVSILGNVDIKLEPKASVQLEAYVLGEGAVNPAVTWTVQSGGGQFVGTGNPITYTAPDVLDGGPVVVRATSVANTTQFAERSITIKPAASGLLDTTFGTAGLAQASFAGLNGSALAVVAQPDGKLIVVGYSYISATSSGTDNDFAIARFNTNGTLDTSFDGDGKQTTNFELNGADPSNDQARAVALQSDGKIVVAGSTRNATREIFAIARYNTNGGLDSSFGTGGKRTISFGDVFDQATAIGVQGDDKIVIAGRAYLFGTGPVPENHDFALARLDTNGSLDTSFDSDGKVTTSIGAYDAADALSILANGKILVAGGVRSVQSDPPLQEATADYVLVRYNSNGTLDSSFDADGIVRTDVVAGTSDFAHAMTVDAQGRILVGGRSKFPWNFSAVRYLSTGVLDLSFGTNGRYERLNDSSGSVEAILNVPGGDVMLVGGGLTLVRLDGNGQFKNEAKGLSLILSADSQGYSRSFGAVAANNAFYVVGSNGSQEFGLVKFLR